VSNRYASKEEREAEEFSKWGKTPPKVAPHGTDTEIRERLATVMPSTWRLEGNQLIGESELGRFVQTIPTDYILTGSDEKGLPVFKKVVL